MKFIAILLTLVAFATGLGSYFAGEQGSSEPALIAERPKKNLPAFRSESELDSFFRKLKKQLDRKQRGGGGGGGKQDEFALKLESVDVAGAAPSASEVSVTNVQHAGVDEGGIVKLHGDHLVILRRGRLFTISIKDSLLTPVSSIDAFGPDLDPDGAWYDEMLISKNTIVVIGYSYHRTGTEIGLFNIDDEGRLKYRSTYHLRSSDYYSSRNYASRLIGNKLIFYSSLDFSLEADTISDSLPALRKWSKGADDDDFKRIIPATRIYRGQREFDANERYSLHTVTTCGLSRDDMLCEATAVLGPSGHVFYVSPASVYLWASQWWNDDGEPMLYRMPLDGSSPSALRVSGSPVDQFSFLESADSHLNVLVRSESKGDGMWAAETAEGDVALMRVPLASFSDGSAPVAAHHYRPLPKLEGYAFQNRFAGEYILYGTGSGWGEPQAGKKSALYAAKWNGDGVIWSLPLQHGVDRIDLLGAHAIVVGTDGKDLHFTSVRLEREPKIADRYTFERASQGETRSHGFFYKPTDDNSGILGLPLRGSGRPGYEHLFEDSASIVFLENHGLKLKPIGELRPRPERAVEDGCKASCVDWYGNARPLFIRGRIFALLGYEIVEGMMNGKDVSEVRRASFAPSRGSGAKK